MLQHPVCIGYILMATSSAVAPGKIILSGEYSMVFGHPGIATPTKRQMKAIFQESDEVNGIEIQWNELAGVTSWRQYIKGILKRCVDELDIDSGILAIENNIPLGKGMGSSTAIVIAVAKCLLGPDCKEKALAIEDELNFGHSGMDFSVVWHNEPILFQKGKDVQPIELDPHALAGAYLIDTGKPGESTVELVADIRNREAELTPALEAIGECTKKLAAGEPLENVMREHHRAQVQLGVVPESVQKLIEEIEKEGGSAKVIGAGGKTGGGGMVLALNIDTDLLDNYAFSYFPLES